MKFTTTHLIFLFCVFLSAILNAQESEWIWQYPSPQSNGLFDIHVFDENNAIAVGQTATVLITSDGGTNWEVNHYAANVEADLAGVHFVNHNEGWAVGDGGTIIKTIESRSYMVRTK